MDASLLMDASHLITCLGRYSTSELRSMLGEPLIEQLASRYFERIAQDNLDSRTDTVDPNKLATASEESPPDKVKRPLNAFMAFRSYYLKIFPHAQQKAASGFLTTLWNQDPFRHRWTLIAKVYSFVRDEMGKSKVALSHFLRFCCPLMGIIQPENYLQSLGWAVNITENGEESLALVDATASARVTEQVRDGLPQNEMELLKAMLNIGYLPEENMILLTKMYANGQGIMSTNPQNLQNQERRNFVKAIQNDPIAATKDLMGEHWDVDMVHECGVRLFNVDDLDSIEHLPMQPPPPPPRPYYSPFPLSQVGLIHHPQMPFHEVQDHQALDIGNPWDVDALLGYPEVTEETMAPDPTLPYDPTEDVWYPF